MSDYRELINEAIKLSRGHRLNEEEEFEEPIDNLDDENGDGNSSGSNVINVSKDLTDAFDNFLDLLASSISDLEDEAGTDEEAMNYIVDLTARGQKIETSFSRLKEVLLKAPKKLGGPQPDVTQQTQVDIPPEPETKMKAGFGSAEDGEEIVDDEEL